VLPVLRGCVKPVILAAVITARPGGGQHEPSIRRSPGRPAVPLDRIVATALQIVDEEGADALSMRVLAQRLDSGTATLYRHFASRAELTAQVVDRVFGEVEFDPDGLNAMSWQQACQTLVHNMFDVLRRHRNVSPLLVEQVPIGPNAMAQRERCIAMLLDHGFAPQLAARSYATLARYVLGFAIQLTGDSTTRQIDDAQLSAVFRGLDASVFPATAAIADLLPVSLADEFAFGLELIITGLAQLHGSGPRPRNTWGAVARSPKP